MEAELALLVHSKKSTLWVALSCFDLFDCLAASLHIEYPMLFKVESRSSGRSTHCGVLEFSADEGMAYMPYWVHSYFQVSVWPRELTVA